MHGRTYSRLSFLLLTIAVGAPLGGAQGKKPLAKPTEKRDIYPANVDAKGEIAPTLNKNFVVVHVNIGEFDKNLDIADKYEVPLKKGVPASVVLESDGKLLFSQRHGEFEAARSMATEDVLVFLNKWKPDKSAN
jgi:hypothetical protein